METKPKIKIDDAKRKRIIADYVQTGSYRATGRSQGVSEHTVKKCVEEDPCSAQMCARKKEQDTKTMLEFMEARTDKAQKIVDKYLDELAKTERLEKMDAREIAVAMAVVIDKFTGVKTQQSGTEVPKVQVIFKRGKEDDDNNHGT